MWPLVAAAAIIVAPMLVFAWLIADPARNPTLNGSVEHFAITTNVALLAAALAALLVRAAMQIRRHGVLFIALGFVVLAGLFAVHGLATPDVLLRGADADPAAFVLALSAQLSLLVAAAMFALRYTPLVERLDVRTARPLPVVAVVAAALGAYALIALRDPEIVAAAARSVMPAGMHGYGHGADGYGGYGGASASEAAGAGALVPAAVTVALLAFATWRQARAFVVSRLPMQGALAVSYVLLAEAQIPMVFAPAGTLAWWEYHALMLAALLLAVGAQLVELDRRRGLERFLPSTVVDRVLANNNVSLAGERRVVTMLFADMRGSTSLAETLDPAALVRLVNEYLGSLARCVFDHGGVLDKFTGDGLMAIFGVVDDGTRGAEPAARAALAIRRAVMDVSDARTARGDVAVKFGVGINTGDVVLGAIGLPERSDYTAIGDAVNTAARMEALCKELKVDIVLSAETAALIAGRIATRPLGEAEIRGKSQRLRIFTLS